MRRLLRIALVVILASVIMPLSAQAHAFRARGRHPHGAHSSVHRYRHRSVGRIAWRRRLAARRRLERLRKEHRYSRRYSHRYAHRYSRRFSHRYSRRFSHRYAHRYARVRHIRHEPQLPHGHQSASSLHPRYHRIAKGVGFWEGRLLTPAGPVRMQALKVDLRYAAVAPVAALSPKGKFSLERTSVMARRDHAVAGINGSFFSFTSQAPAGMLIVGGKILAGPDSRPALVVRQNGTASILPDHSAMNVDPLQAVGGGPTLLRDGRLKFWGRPPAIGGRQPRTAVGIGPGRQVVLLTIDGRSRGSVGATLPEEARYMAALGARDAINLDGGGSTTMVVAGHVVNHPSDGSERAISDSLLVLRRPLHGHLPAQFQYSGFKFLGS